MDERQRKSIFLERVRILPEHQKALQALASRNAMRQSEAIRLALTAGLRELGVWPEQPQRKEERHG